MMILVINLIGGVCIGIFKYNLSVDVVFQQYVLMIIGDGLVVQIFFLLFFMVVVIIVICVSDNGDIVYDVCYQLLVSLLVFYIVIGIMFVLVVVLGMLYLLFLLFSVLFGFIGWWMSKQLLVVEVEEKSFEMLICIIIEISEQQVSWEIILLIEFISLSFGYKLVVLVDKVQGNLFIQWICGVWQVIFDGNGVLLLEICIWENFCFKFSQYVIFINGIKVDEVDILVDKLMVLFFSEIYGEIDGVQGNDLVYGMLVIWIQVVQKVKVLNMGYQVIDSVSVIVIYVNKIVCSYIFDLFNYDDIMQLYNCLVLMVLCLVEDLSVVFNYSQLLKVYWVLLIEGVFLCDIVIIVIVLVVSSVVIKDYILLVVDVCLVLWCSIIYLFVCKQELMVYMLNNELENLLINVVNQV